MNGRPFLDFFITKEKVALSKRFPLAAQEVLLQVSKEVDAF
jgi:hypothetical protein